MNVNKDDFLRYLDLFHSVLDIAARQDLPSDILKKLRYLSYYPCKVIGYISTQFGIGFEYLQSPLFDIEIITGSSRVEDLFLHAPKNLRKTPPLIMTAGLVNLFNCTIEGAFPFRLSGDNSKVIMGGVVFRADPWIKCVLYAELHGNRKLDNWSPDKAVARAKNVVLSALVDLSQASLKKVSIDQYIDQYKERTVLLLGDYGIEGLKRLHLIKNILIKYNYEPILSKDIPDHPYHDLSQKIIAIGAISRFIVIDDSSKSGHIMELNICKNNDWITIILRTHESSASWMTASASHYSNVIIEKSYDPHSADESIKECIDWAEDKLLEFEEKLKNIYPWRKETTGAQRRR
jgi:hypothetical protein